MKYKFAHGWLRSNLVNGLAVSANGPKNLKLGILGMLKYYCGAVLNMFSET
jgi:hypothetical protein